MRQLTSIFVILAMILTAIPAFAIEGKEVGYVSGTIPAIKEGTVGEFDTASETALEFHSSTGQFSIPYSRIVAYQYRQEAKFHLGVLPAIAVGLVKKRAKRHFLTLTWLGERNVPEEAIFEISKDAPQGMLALLKARATEACKPKSGHSCSSVW